MAQNGSSFFVPRVAPSLNFHIPKKVTNGLDQMPANSWWRYFFFRRLLKFQLSLPFFRIVCTHTGIHIKVWLDRATLPCNGQKLVFGKYWCNLTFIGVTGQLQTLMERTYDLSYQIQVLGGFRNRWRDSTRDANVRESYQIRLLSSLPHSPKLTFDLNSSSNHSCCASNWV